MRKPFMFNVHCTDPLAAGHGGSMPGAALPVHWPVNPRCGILPAVTPAARQARSRAAFTAMTTMILCACQPRAEGAPPPPTPDRRKRWSPRQLPASADTPSDQVLNHANIL